MENGYWIGRKRCAMAMARKATESEARLIHYELAGLYSIRAAQTAPFMLPARPPATAGEGIALELPVPPLAPQTPWPRPGPASGTRS